MEAVKVIDVSKHNGTIDFKAVKSSEIYGVIIRAGYGRSVSQKDPTFEKYYKDAKEAGLMVGTYWYSYAESPAEAEIEAVAFCKAIEGKSFELPVYYDIEEKKHLSLGLKWSTDFADILKKRDILRAFTLLMLSTQISPMRSRENIQNGSLVLKMSNLYGVLIMIFGSTPGKRP